MGPFPERRRSLNLRLAGEVSPIKKTDLFGTDPGKPRSF
jgi:hypothetical protein